ncbi:hypothetical protein KCU76_g13871, partial [Aureobasidium melanogenum]
MAGDSNESSLRSPPWMLCIVEPPEEGWPSITQDSLAGLEKTEAVIELLRHLPYIEPSEDYNTQVAFGTSVIDYREIGKYKVAEGKSFQFIPAGNEEFPPDVVVLTDEGEDYYGSLLLLDTKKGTATDYQPQAPRKKGVPDPEAAPEIWRYSETLPVADLLALWEQKFRSLEWTADLFNVEGGIMLRHDRATDEAYTFLRHHLQDPTATTINKEVEMTGVVPEDPATPRSSVLQHSSQIPSKTVYYPAARPGARLTPITATILGDSGANCQTQFQAGEYYCIGIRPPSPTQSGIAANCNEYQIPKSGDYCYMFAQNNNITTDELYAWNTFLGTNGVNCQTQFQAEESRTRNIMTRSQKRKRGKKGTRTKHTAAGIPTWSPTVVLICRSTAYVWQSGRDAQFSANCG